MVHKICLGIHQVSFLVVCKVIRKMKSSVKPFGCALCRKGFVTSKSLADHIKRFHEDPKNLPKFDTVKTEKKKVQINAPPTNPESPGPVELGVQGMQVHPLKLKDVEIKPFPLKDLPLSQH